MRSSVSAFSEIRRGVDFNSILFNYQQHCLIVFPPTVSEDDDNNFDHFPCCFVCVCVLCLCLESAVKVDNDTT